MASKKTAAASKVNGRDSNPKHLGPKKFDGELVKAGHILVRQRGTPIHAGHNVGMGKDDTLFSLIAGKVKYAHRKNRHWVDVQPLAQE